MNSPPSVPGTVDIRERVFHACIRQYYEQLSFSVIAVVFNTSLLAIVLWDSADQRLLGSWCVASLSIACYRILTTIRFKRQSEESREASSQVWHRRLLFGTALSGLTWGSAAFFFYDPSDLISSALLAFVVAGMCAGSIVSLSAFAEASILFVCICLLPFIARILMAPDGSSTAMAGFAGMFLFMMVAFGRRVNRTVVSGFEMQFLRSRAEATVERQALFDELTGLPNRRLLRDRLDQTIARVRRHDKSAALLFMDLDFFKRVNDSLGHRVGDQLLMEIAYRMRALLRREDTAARLGGDEFVALLTDIEGDKKQVMEVVRRRGDELRRAIEAPVDIDGNEIHITVSIGVSMLPGDTDDAEDILTHADTAMYRAKEDGRNTLRFFVADMQHELADRMDLERKLRAALDKRDEFSLYMQPQFDEDLKVCGAEFLLRWQRDGEFIPPSVFIPIAEDSGLIYRLGDWVTEEACRIAAALEDDIADRDFSLALNVSPRQFRQKDFTSKILHWINHYNLPPGLIELELTEGLLIDDVDDTAEKMRRLRANGLRFSIDDFGTGYSSLQYLKSLPLDTLKIDQSFVRDVLSDPGDASIVRAVISMSKALDLQVIAEGVETAAIHDFLIDAGCTRFQGYLYSRPRPFEEFLAHLREPEAALTAD
ncbi:MAG: hypothetical protein Cons2KO_31470 [Congregibacter sp.]